MHLEFIINSAHYVQLIKFNYKHAKILIPYDRHSAYVFNAGTHLVS